MPLLHQASQRWSAPSAVAALAMIVGGCHEQDFPHFGTLRYDSDNFEVWASDGLEACGGTFEYAEKWLAAFRQRVGERGSPARHTFYWLSEDEYNRGICPVGIACAYLRANVIYSTVIPVEHEIVHTELDSRPPRSS